MMSTMVRNRDLDQARRGNEKREGEEDHAHRGKYDQMKRQLDHSRTVAGTN